MGILDGQLGKQTFLSPLVDRLLEAKQLLNIGLAIFFAGIRLTPFVFYFGFAYFTAKTAPWWLDTITDVWVLSIFFGGLILLLLGLAKFIGSREDWH